MYRCDYASISGESTAPAAIFPWQGKVAVGRKGLEFLNPSPSRLRGWVSPSRGEGELGFQESPVDFLPLAGEGAVGRKGFGATELLMPALITRDFGHALWSEISPKKEADDRKSSEPATDGETRRAQGEAASKRTAGEGRIRQQNKSFSTSADINPSHSTHNRTV